MCKKSIWIFIKYYCFVWFSTKKRFTCAKSSNNEYLLKNTFAGYESIALILLGLSMAIVSYFYDKEYIFSFFVSIFAQFVYSLLIVIYVWFLKLDDIFND